MDGLLDDDEEVMIDAGIPVEVLKRRQSKAVGGHIEGYLVKQGGMMKTWRKRFFTMRTTPCARVDLKPFASERVLSEALFNEIKNNINKGCGLLFYYDGDEAVDSNLKGAVNLRGCEGIVKFEKGKHGSKNFPYAFQILVPSQRNFIIAATTEKEQDLWVLALEDVVSNLKDAHFALTHYLKATGGKNHATFLWS